MERLGSVRLWKGPATAARRMSVQGHTPLHACTRIRHTHTKHNVSIHAHPVHTHMHTHTRTTCTRTLLPSLLGPCLLPKWFAGTLLLHHHLVVLFHKLELKTSTGEGVWWGEGSVDEQLLVNNGLQYGGKGRGKVWQGAWQGCE